MLSLHWTIPPEDFWGHLKQSVLAAFRLKIQLLIGLNLYNKILDNISKDLSSKFQDNLYPNRAKPEAVFLCQQCVRVVVGCHL